MPRRLRRSEKEPSLRLPSSRVSFQELNAPVPSSVHSVHSGNVRPNLLLPHQLLKYRPSDSLQLHLRPVVLEPPVDRECDHACGRSRCGDSTRERADVVGSSNSTTAPIAMNVHTRPLRSHKPNTSARSRSGWRGEASRGAGRSSSSARRLGGRFGCPGVPRRPVEPQRSIGSPGFTIADCGDLGCRLTGCSRWSRFGRRSRECGRAIASAIETPTTTDVA